MQTAQRSPNAQDRGFLTQIPAGILWAILTLFALLCIIGLALWLWVFRQPVVVENIIPAAPPSLSAETQARIQALTQEAAALEAALAADKARTPACPPGQRLRLGAVPAPASPLPPTAEMTGPLATLSTSALAARLEAATALVLTEKSVATGFFIAPDLLVTNRHAVEDAKQRRVLIASRSLGNVRPGIVLRTSPPGQPGATDFAVVRLEEGVAPATVSLTDQAPKLSAVVAAGYPGLTLQNDPGFRRLVAGDAAAAPDLNLTQGVIQSLQTTAAGVPVVLHTASILQGNSGGPLVDPCGRVIGINTFIAVDTEQSGRTAYAQASLAIARFLAEGGTRLPLDSRVCPT